MNYYLKLLGLGALLWVIMFAVVSAVLSYYNAFDIVKFAVAIIGGVVAFLLGRYFGFTDYKSAFITGFAWVIVGIVLDALVTFKFNPDIFTYWSLWLGYALVVAGAAFSVRRQSITPQV